MAKAILYENSNYSGYSVQVTLDIPDFTKIHFNDRLTSAKVESGTFTLYEHVNFGGSSVTICSTGGPSSDGNYPSSAFLGGRNDFYSSIRRNSDKP